MTKALAAAAAAWLALAGATAAAQDARTLKERLSDKASDNQRVNNCRVPVEERGPTPRPGCPAKRPEPPASAAAAPARRR